jgi:hypothetical protein
MTSSSRSQVAVPTASGASCMTWEPSKVHWRPLLSVVIVTDLVTRPLVSWRETASALSVRFVGTLGYRRCYENLECHRRCRLRRQSGDRSPAEKRRRPPACDRPGMTLHCVLVGVVLHCQAVKPAATEADCVRRVGVLVALVGTLVAAPEGTLLIGRWIWAALRAVGLRIWVFLARFLPFLRRSANVQGVTASGRVRFPSFSVRASGLELLPDADLKERMDLLDEHIVRAFGEIEKARQETAAGDEELRRIIEQQAGELRAVAEAHKVAHAAAQRQSAQVDARGVVLIGAGVVMTGVPDGLAVFPWSGWLVVALALAGTAWAIVWVVSDMRKTRMS